MPKNEKRVGHTATIFQPKGGKPEILIERVTTTYNGRGSRNTDKKPITTFSLKDAATIAVGITDSLWYLLEHGDEF